MSLNDFQVKLGAATGVIVGITSANMVTIAEAFNKAGTIDLKTAAYAFGSAVLGGMAGSAYMSDRTADMPLMSIKSIDNLTLPKNRGQFLKPLAGAMIGTAMWTSAWLYEKSTQENVPNEPPRYELRR